MMFKKAKKEPTPQEQFILTLIDDINSGEFDEDIINIEHNDWRLGHIKVYEYCFDKVGHPARGTCVKCEIGFEYVQYGVINQEISIYDVRPDIAKKLFNAMDEANLRNKKRKQDKIDKQLLEYVNNHKRNQEQLC